ERADDAVVREDGDAGVRRLYPLPLFDDVGVGLPDQVAHASERGAAPVAVVRDAFGDERFGVGGHHAASRRRPKKYEAPHNTSATAAHDHANGPSPIEKCATSADTS